MKPDRKSSDGLLVDSEGRPFRASDIRAIAGLTYRQLNQWSTKGAISSERESAKGWRRFTFNEIFAIMICAEFRHRYGTSIELLQWLWSSMSECDVPLLDETLETMKEWRIVCLCTDLRGLMFLTEDASDGKKFEDYLSQNGESPRSFIALELNPLVERIMTYVRKQILSNGRLDLHEAVKGKFHVDLLDPDDAEYELLKLIRERDSQHVRVTKKDGKVVKVDSEDEFPKKLKLSLEKEIRKSIPRTGYRNFDIKVRDGRIVSALRKRVIKPVR